MGDEPEKIDFKFYIKNSRISPSAFRFHVTIFQAGCTQGKDHRQTIYHEEPKNLCYYFIEVQSDPANFHAMTIM